MMLFCTTDWCLQTMTGQTRTIGTVWIITVLSEIVLKSRVLCVFMVSTHFFFIDMTHRTGGYTTEEKHTCNIQTRTWEHGPSFRSSCRVYFCVRPKAWTPLWSRPVWKRLFRGLAIWWTSGSSRSSAIVSAKTPTGMSWNLGDGQTKTKKRLISSQPTRENEARKDNYITTDSVTRFHLDQIKNGA